MAYKRQDRGQRGDELTLRELEVLRLMPGCDVRRTAWLLGVSIRTVESHRHRIFRKMGTWDRTSTVVRGADLGLISLRAVEDSSEGHGLELTDLQLEIILLSAGYQSKRIARMLEVSENRIKGQRTSIFARLNVHSMTEAVVVAIRSGQLDVLDAISVMRESIGVR